MIKSTLILVFVAIFYIPWYYVKEPTLSNINSLLSGFEVIAHFSLLFVYWGFFKLFKDNTVIIKSDPEIAKDAKDLAIFGIFIAMCYSILGILYGNAISDSQMIQHILDIGYALCDIYVAFLLFFLLDFMTKVVFGRALYGRRKEKVL